VLYILAFQITIPSGQTLINRLDLAHETI